LKKSVFIVLEITVSMLCALIGKYLCKKHPIIGSLMGSIFGSAGVRYVQKVAFA